MKLKIAIFFLILISSNSYAEEEVQENQESQQAKKDKKRNHKWDDTTSAWKAQREKLNLISNEELKVSSSKFYESVTAKQKLQDKIKLANEARVSAIKLISKTMPSLEGKINTEIWWDNLAKYLIGVVQDRNTIETIAVAVGSLATVKCQQASYELERHSFSYELFTAASAMYLALLTKRVGNHETIITEVESSSKENIKETGTSKMINAAATLQTQNVSLSADILESRIYFGELITWAHLYARDEKNTKNASVHHDSNDKHRERDTYRRKKKEFDYKGEQTHLARFRLSKKALKRSQEQASLNCAISEEIVAKVKNQDGSGTPHRSPASN